MRSKQADHYIRTLSKQVTPYFRTIKGIKLRIDKGVYPTGELGKLFFSAVSLPIMNVNPETTVLDYGTGSGFLAIAAAKRGARVIALDKNPAAIRCAKYNAKQNKVQDRIDFRISHNLSAIKPKETFDLVLAGLPWESANPKTPLEMAFYDRRFSMRKELAKKGSNLLKPNGSMLLSYAKRVEEAAPLKKVFTNYAIDTLLEKDIDDEPHYIFRLKPT